MQEIVLKKVTENKMRIVIPSIRTEKMTLVAEEQTVKIKGRLDVQFPKQTLGLFLNNLHKEVCKKNGDMIYLDITELSYVNSASIREFLSWLLFVLKLPEGQKYNVYVKLSQEEICQASLGKSLALLYNRVALFDVETNERLDPKLLKV